jgi:RING-like zinc finger/Zinc finger, ZZ type
MDFSELDFSLDDFDTVAAAQGPTTTVSNDASSQSPSTSTSVATLASSLPVPDAPSHERVVHVLCHLSHEMTKFVEERPSYYSAAVCDHCPRTMLEYDSHFYHCTICRNYDLCQNCSALDTPLALKSASKHKQQTEAAQHRDKEDTCRAPSSRTTSSPVAPPPVHESSTSSSSLPSGSPEGGQSLPPELSWSVRMFPPNASDVPPDLFRELAMDGVNFALGTGRDGRDLQYTDRGFSDSLEFGRELDAAFRDTAYHIKGIVIARAQSKLDADALVKGLLEVQVNAKAENNGNPELYTQCSPPPQLKRGTNVGGGDEGEEECTMVIPSTPAGAPLASDYAPQSRIHEVVLYLPPEAPNISDSAAMRHFVHRWLQESLPAVQNALARPDPLEGRHTNRDWPSRGFEDAQQFQAHVAMTLLETGRCLVAREQTHRDAFLVFSRLQRRGFRVSELAPAASTAGGQYFVLAGEQQGSTVAHPMDSSGRPGPRGGGRGNQKPSTKKAVRDSLTVTVFSRAKCLSGDGDTCCICMDEFHDGEHIAKLPCGHTFHQGKEDSGGQVVDCGGILPWLQSSNECPVCRHELEPEEGTGGDRWTCPGCKQQRTMQTCGAW